MNRPFVLHASLSFLVAAVGFYGCESPESFHLSGDGSLLMTGSGGDGSIGSGGAIGPGTGGRLVVSSGGTSNGGTIGVGGMVGSGGRATGGGGATSAGGGTAVGGGGAVGSGGRAVGGAVGSGGRAAGGTVGSGGRAAGGAVGSGGATPGTGGAAGGATGTGGRGGSTATGGNGGAIGGTGPCAGLCAPATAVMFTSGTTYSTPSGGVGTGVICYEIATTLTINGGGCSNCVVSGVTPNRTMKINGTTVANTNQWATPLPAKVNGGYCFQITAGNPNYTAFYTF